MQLIPFILAASGLLVVAHNLPPPPLPEPIEVIELPLPPVAASTDDGACTAAINPHGTGCIGQISEQFQSGDFTPDGMHVVVNVEFVGAPAAPEPASIYTGQQLILVKTDGTYFSNGDPWKCLSCGVPAQNAVSLDPARDYPHAFRDGKKAIWGHNILDCGGLSITSDECTVNQTHIYPIHWQITTDDSGSAGSPREMRVHPDGVHIGWSSLTNGGQATFFGRLEFNPSPASGTPLAPRYDLVDVNLLVHPNGKAPITANDTELHLNDDAISVGELHGFSGSGDEILYIGSPREASNIDLFAVHVVTGAVRRLTSHPEYADPIAFSADNQWFVTMDTRGSNRQMWMSGMRKIPPLVDIVAVTAASSTRNNGPRRFFQPILIDRYGDRDDYDYYGQRVNAAGNGSDGSINDPNWNGRADPAFSLDSTRIVFWQALVISPSCGGVNPLPCPVSTAQGGRTYRLMLARLTSRQPKAAAPVFSIPDTIPWATPFPPGTSLPTPSGLSPGNYTLRGKASGIAKVALIVNPSGSGLRTVSVNYTDYSDDEKHIINGYEEVSVTVTPPAVWLDDVDWYSVLVGTGIVNATKKTSPGGFHLEIDAMTNIFNANGTLVTTIDGVVYTQPANDS